MKSKDDYNELRQEIQEHNKKVKRIRADYEREVKAAWNRWEDGDERSVSS